MCPPSAFIAASGSPTTSTEIPAFVPKDGISQAAYTHAAKHVHEAILNHSIRVYLYALSLGQRESSPWTAPHRLHLLFTGCILHDVGTASIHDGPQRFEIEAADVAVKLLTENGVSEADAHEVWVAMALHSTPGIAERITPLARLVRLGVKSDFSPAVSKQYMPQDEVKDAEGKFPRLSIEKILGDLVAEQGVRQPEKAPHASWPGGLLKAKLKDPNYEGVNPEF